MLKVVRRRKELLPKVFQALGSNLYLDYPSGFKQNGSMIEIKLLDTCYWCSGIWRGMLFWRETERRRRAGVMP